MFLPILFVLVADFVDEGKARVPFAGALRLRHAGKLRHQRAVIMNARERHDGSDLEFVGPLHEPRARFREEVSQFHRVTRLEFQIIREPLANDDFVIAEVRRRPRCARSRDHRVGRHVRPGSELVDEVGEDGLRRIRGQRCFGCWSVEEDAARAKLDGLAIGKSVQVEFQIRQRVGAGQCLRQ